MSKKQSRKAKSLRAAPRTKTRVNKNTNRQMGTPNVGTLWHNSAIIGVADCCRTKLRYVLPFQPVTSAGAAASLKFTSNAYDVDAALGNTAMAYFTDLANIYSRFRTLSMRYVFDVCTNEAYGLPYVHGFMTQSLSATGVGLNYAENPYMKIKHTGGASAVSTARLTGSVTTARLFGTQQALYDDLFTGSTTSSTLSASATMFLYCGAVGIGPLAAGFNVTGTIELDVMFFRRNSLFS